MTLARTRAFARCRQPLAGLLAGLANDRTQIPLERGGLTGSRWIWFFSNAFAARRGLAGEQEQGEKGDERGADGGQDAAQPGADRDGEGEREHCARRGSRQVEAQDVSRSLPDWVLTCRAVRPSDTAVTRPGTS